MVMRHGALLLVLLAGAPAHPAQLERSAAPVPAPAGNAVMIGESRIDLDAPGAASLITALGFEPPRAILGAFKPREARALNSFPAGLDGVVMHIHTLPQNFHPENIGAYTFLMRRDGTYEFKGSGSVFSPITGPVQRSILRHLGVRPARETVGMKLKRAFLRVYDWLLAHSFQPGPDEPPEWPF